jgi:hypothetical protein
MVLYEDVGDFPAASEALWTLLQAHLDDERIHSIHPLVLTQQTLSRSGSETIVERTIDARGKSMRSKWKITYLPPEVARWEIVESEGPWKAGTYLENRYSPVPGGTRVRSRGELKISVLPFFLPQKPVIHRVLDQLDAEDIAAVTR